MKGDYQYAFVNNAKSIDLFFKIKSNEQLFLANYNQSVYVARMRQLEISNYYLEQASQYSSTLKDSLMINRALATNYSNQLRYVEALKVIEGDLSRLNEVDDIDTVMGYKVVAVDIYARNLKLEKSFEILKELNKILKNPFRSRVAFEFQIVSYLLNDETKEITWPSFLKNDSDYKLKVKIIDLLKTGQIDDAKKFWVKLSRKFPGIYLQKFEVKYASDRDTLFYNLIKKLESKNISSKELHLKGKLNQLHLLLTQQKFPTSKEELIEKIWGISYDPSYDSRFYKLIQRLKIHVTVLNVSGAYSINSTR